MPDLEGLLSKAVASKEAHEQAEAAVVEAQKKADEAFATRQADHQAFHAAVEGLLGHGIRHELRDIKKQLAALIGMESNESPILSRIDAGIAKLIANSERVVGIDVKPAPPVDRP